MSADAMDKMEIILIEDKRRPCYCLCPVAAYNDGVGRAMARFVAGLQQNCRMTR